MKPIYLDYAATTPVDKRVAEKMAQYLTIDGIFGNPASKHIYGETAKHHVEEARSQVAELVYADPSEIIWTSSATEANNLSIKGAAELYQAKGKHIITLKTEHPSVLDSCRYLESRGFSVTELDVQKNGLLDLELLQAELRAETILVSIMHVNNEIGVIQDIEKIAEITAARGILLHVDAVQSVGKLPINLQKTPIDLMAFSAHKIYGPKGIGALFVRKKPRVRLAPQIHGGGQERGMRSGTLPTHQIIGMGAAFRIAQEEMQKDQTRILDLRNKLLAALTKSKKVTLNGDPNLNIPNILNFRFAELTSNTFMQKFPEFAISSGSACNTKGIEPSYVLRALGLRDEEAQCGVRFSFGRFTTKEDIDLIIDRLS